MLRATRLALHPDKVIFDILTEFAFIKPPFAAILVGLPQIFTVFGTETHNAPGDRATPSSEALTVLCKTSKRV